MGFGECANILRVIHEADRAPMSKFALNHIRFLTSVAAGIILFICRPRHGD